MTDNNPPVVVPVSEFSVPSPIVEVSESTPGSPSKGVFPFPVPTQPSATTSYNTPPPSSMGGGTTGTTTSSSSVVNPPLLVGLERRGSAQALGSAPDSRRGSNQSTGQAMYGGLPPLEPSSNPRRGSATGSYGLPVPPDWIRAHTADKVRGGLGGGGGGARGGSYLQASSSLLGLSGGRDYSPTRFKPSKQAVQKFPPPATYQSNGIHKNQVGCSYLSTLHIVCNV